MLDLSAKYNELQQSSLLDCGETVWNMLRKYGNRRIKL